MEEVAFKLRYRERMALEMFKPLKALKKRPNF